MIVLSGVTKGVAHNLFVETYSQSTLFPGSQANVDAYIITISKDEGPFVPVTNAVIKPTDF